MWPFSKKKPTSKPKSDQEFPSRFYDFYDNDLWVPIRQKLRNDYSELSLQEVAEDVVKTDKIDDLFNIEVPKHGEEMVKHDLYKYWVTQYDKEGHRLPKRKRKTYGAGFSYVKNKEDREFLEDMQARLDDLNDYIRDRKKTNFGASVRSKLLDRKIAKERNTVNWLTRSGPGLNRLYQEDMKGAEPGDLPEVARILAKHRAERAKLKSSIGDDE